MVATVTIKKVWQHTRDSRCAYCGKTIRMTDNREHNITNVEYGIDNYDYCANHKISTVRKHFKSNALNYKGLTSINWVSDDKLYQ